MGKSRLLAVLSVLTILTTNFLSCTMGEDGADGKDGKDGKDAPSIAEQTFDVIVEELTLKTVYKRELVGGKVSNTDYITLGFRDGMEEIPYIPIANSIIKALKGNHYSVSEVNADTTEVTITNSETNTKAVIDLVKHEFYFDNYDAFFQTSEVYSDTAAVNLIGDYMKITDASNVPGQPILLDWRKHDIGVIIWKDAKDKCCLAIPLQTYNDIFNGAMIYNGKNLYSLYAVNDSSAVADDYYGTDPAPGKRSKALAEFCYNELCMNLDLNYGLKEIHGIASFPDFDSYFEITGIRDDLKSTDALTFANAIKDVCDFYFGDGHSVYDKNSYYLGKDAVPTAAHTSAMYKNGYENYVKYIFARNEKIGNSSTNKEDPVSCYTVSADGKTAIVRFDHFTLNDLKKAQILELLSDFDEEKMNAYVHNLEDEYDTIALIHAINEKIKANPSIENIVLDVSCNGGGANHSAAFVLSWLLGECVFDFTNPITGAKWSATYKADVNFDGEYNDGDTVKEKNLFCLISPVSFSCGNLVPSMLKASDRVTILGAKSGGGTSVVYHTCAADGTLFHVSSKTVMSVAKNGSNYDIDIGIEPHYYINKPENFYDTEKISGLVNAINEATLAN
ncbi:S41 family peptidase [uncultured Treponema sp.]|uniref:S41 family peptidase n=1 Tax=uncultured Treponema sp. TaxID=162155 RepID=UPI0025FF31BC|nr:S41 family peptidase [uncultured Treponema sp.]